MKKKNQFSRSILLLLVMMFAQTALLAQTATLPTGSGTEGDPYQIANLNNLYWITQNSGKWTNTHYKQTANINASSTKFWDYYAGFSPIGNDVIEFSGSSYDGQGFSISGLYISRYETENIGLFGYIAGATTLKNIVLKDVNIEGSAHTAALAGINSGGLIDNCSTSGTVTGNDFGVGGLVGSHYGGVIKNSTSNCTVDASYADKAGGLVGENYATTENSFATGNVTSTNRKIVGGFIGLNYSGGTVQNCYSTGTVSGKSEIGGFIGQNNTGTVQNCYSTGAVTGTTNVGGFLGQYISGTVTNCFWDTETSGRATSAAGTGKTTFQMNDKATYTDWDFTDPWVIAGYNKGYPSLDRMPKPAGDGTSDDPYLITTLDNLYWLSQNTGNWTGKHYKQTANIDASSTSTWDDGKGFSPIGDYRYGALADIDEPFIGGSYDGQGYSISGLFINRNNHYAGLFGYTSDGTKLKNIVLENVDITGAAFTAALIGYSYGNASEIDNCSASGTVKGLDYVGGLVGIHDDGVIKNSASSCTVTGSSNFVGGLVGRNIATIENSFATGNVSASSATDNSSYYGGFIGLNSTDYGYSGTVTNCYSTGAVTNSSGGKVGGFIGGSDGGATVQNCYSTGTVTGTTDIGGFMGQYSSGIVTNCFWDKDTSDRENSAAGTAKITAEMKTKSTFKDWDFIGETANGTADYWNINSAINGGYPYLMWQSGEYFAWTGSSSTAVNVATNWSSSVVPTITDNISIPNVSAASNNFPVISNTETLSCNNLEILSGASLTIEAGGALLVNGTVSSAGTVTHNETLTGPVYTYHLISAPTQADISESNFAPVSGEDNFYAWDQADPGTWVNYLNTEAAPYFGDVNGGDNFVAGKGYLVAYNSVNPEKSFVGTPNSGTIGFTLKYDASNPSSAGSNLLGNPYAAYIDWNKADRNLLADNYAYVYNPIDGGRYDYINGEAAGAWLKPHAGFFVIALATSNDKTFNFSPAMQGINSGKKDQSAEPQKLILKLSGEQFYEQAILSINSNSTAARDRNDAIFMGSYNANVPQLYSMTSDGVKVAINSLPTVTSGQSIALGMTFPEDGEYIFSASITGESFEQEIIYLRDTETGTYHKLDKPVVLFAEAGQTDEKYELVFGPTGIEVAAFAETKYAVAYNNNYLTILGEDGELSVELIDLNGRTLYKNNHQLAGGTLRILNTSAKGLVLLKLTNGAAIEVHKVIVR